MECRRGEGTSIECQRVDVKEQVWNVREVKKQVYNVRIDVKEHVWNVGEVKEHGGGGYRGKYRGWWV